MDAKDVAMAAYKGMMKNKRVIIPGTANKLWVVFSKLVPRAISANIIGKIQQRLIYEFHS